MASKLAQFTTDRVICVATGLMVAFSGLYLFASSVEHTDAVLVAAHWFVGIFLLIVGLLMYRLGMPSGKESGQA